MPRTPRVVLAGEAHHVTQRGNRRDDVFFGDGDRRLYLSLLGEHAERQGLAVLAWCLMRNHVHLVVRPARVESLADALSLVHQRYAQHINRTQGIDGRLWQGRYFSCVLAGSHLLTAVRYVELNPVRAGLVAYAEDYPWSSAAGHCGLADDPLVTDDPGLRADVPDWRSWLAELGGGDDAVRQATLTGRPLGDASFVNAVEEQTGRSLTPKPVGRPKRGDRQR